MPSSNSAENDKRWKDYYDTARVVFMNEHTRWNSWSLFFAGLIAAVFVGAEKLRIAHGIAFLAAGVVCFFWFISILNIRKSTNCWFQTLCDLERCCPTDDARGAFLRFHEREQKWSYRQDILAGIGLADRQFADTDANKKRRGLFIFQSVTGSIGLLIALASIFFLSAAVWCIAAATVGSIRTFDLLLLST